MTERHQVIPRTLCFIFYDDEVLLMKASASKDWSGTYNPIGGHIEKGESIIGNAIKEIKEEANLDVTDTKLRGVMHVSNFFGKEVMLFVTSSKATTKEVTANDEGELEWVPIKDIESKNIFEDIKDILNHVLTLETEKMFFGVSTFDGKGKLESIDITVS